MSDVTNLLNRLDFDATGASEQLLPLVYEELKKLAASRLAREQPGQTLQATALVHEAYLRLVGTAPNQPTWHHRGHFFAAAAEAMRRILVDNARRKKCVQHGGDRLRVDLDVDPVIEVSDDDAESRDELLALDAALDKLKATDPDAAALVQLRYFSGLTLADAASMLGIPARTADRTWAYAKAWLHREIRKTSEN